MLRGILGFILIALICSCTPKAPVITSVSRVDTIFFQEINRVTDLAGIESLRTVYVPKDDLEVRVWRGFGLSPLEGVLLRRTGNSWSGLHLTADQYFEAQNVQVEMLQPPRSGWTTFATEIVDNGLLRLPKMREEACDENGVDGIGYLVEINHNRTYRSYLYRDGNTGCRESEEMSNIGEVIGLEFDTGTEQCKTAEWFPCMTYRKRQEKNNVK